MVTKTMESNQLLLIAILFLVGLCVYILFTSKRRVRAKVKDCRVQRDNVAKDLQFLKEVSTLDSYKADYGSALRILQSVPYKQLSHIDKLSAKLTHSLIEQISFLWFDIQVSWFIAPKFYRAQGKLQNILERIEKLMNQLKVFEQQLTEMAALTDEPLVIDCERILAIYRSQQPYSPDLIVQAREVKDKLKKVIPELQKKVEDARSLAESIPVNDANTKADVWYCLRELAASIESKSITVIARLKEVANCVRIEDIDSITAEVRVLTDNAGNDHQSLCRSFDHCQELVDSIQDLKGALEREDWQKRANSAATLFKDIEGDIERAKEATSFEESVRKLEDLRKQLRQVLGNTLTRQEVIVNGSKTTTTTITGGVFGVQSSGPDADIHDNVIQASASEVPGEKVDLTKLAEDLARLGQELQKRATEPEHFTAIANVGYATKEAKQGNKQKVLEYLSKVGLWVLNTAEEISVKVAVQMITEALKK